MLQFPKHGNKENLERNSRLRIASGPVFTRHLNATTTMAVRSVTSSPGASLERRFKGRGTWDVGRGARDEEKRAARNNHCSLTLFLKLTLLKEGRGARNEERGKARCEKKSLLTHPVSYTHTTEGAARNEAQGTRNEQLFTVYCSLQRNIPMLLPRQLHRLGFEHPEGADQF